MKTAARRSENRVFSVIRLCIRDLTKKLQKFTIPKVSSVQK